MLAKAEIRITKKKTLFSVFRTGTFRFFGLGEGDTRILFFIRVSPSLFSRAAIFTRPSEF